VSIDLLNEAPVLSFFSSYQTAYQQAAGLVSLQTLGLPTWMQAPNVPDTYPKSFIMSYQPSQAPTQQVPSGSGTPPQLGGVPSPTGPLIFDVALGYQPNAIPQRVAYTEIARQSIEQTAVGFHVNEFGLAPGRLDIDAVIIYQGMEYAQVDSFFSFLRQIKSNNPLGNVTPPGSVLWIDVYLQRQLSITLESVMIEEVAGENNKAHLVMGASILRDFSAPTGGSITDSGFPNATANIEAAAGLLGAVTQFLGVSIPI
jgi:hypothetical protein